MVGCSYGELFEPDPPPGASVLRGQEDAARPLSLSPEFPVPGRVTDQEIQVEAGTEISVQATFAGLNAAGQAGYLWEALTDLSQQNDVGLGPDRIPFELLPRPSAQQQGPHWGEMNLPPHPESLSGSFPLVRVDLHTPLILHQKREDNGKRRVIICPSFADLLRASLRTLGALASLYDEPIDADFAALKSTAEKIELVRANFETFTQPKTSNRSRQKRLLYAATGSGIYANVPQALVHWLAWGGVAHVGVERVAGAGAWNVQWSESTAHPDSEDVQWHEVS